MSRTATRVILDANMLLIFALGKDHPEALGRHRRARAYMPKDFDLLINLIGRFQQVVITPNAVTECSDLLNDSPCENDAKKALKDLLLSPQCMVAEEYVPSAQAAESDRYSYLGIADCAMLSLVDEKTVLLSADGKLVSEAAAINPRSINFNHYRSFV